MNGATISGPPDRRGARFRVRLEPAGRELDVPAGENVLAAALEAGVPLPHSCRAGRCASCKARLLSGEIAYPDERLPPGLAAVEAARGEVLLCQARPRSDLVIRTRLPAGAQCEVAHGVEVIAAVPLATGGVRVTLRILGSALVARPGQFVDVETADGEPERVPVVATATNTIEVELQEHSPGPLVRLRGPYDAPR